MLLVLHLLGKGALVGATVLNMAVWGAVIAYGMQMLSFILLRRKRPDMERPYVSSLGLPGAWVALVIAVITFIVLFLNADYRPAIWWCALWFLAGLAYFALYAAIAWCDRPRRSSLWRRQEGGNAPVGWSGIARS